MLSYSQFGEPPEYEGISESLFHLYRVRTAQCLIIGDISKCLPYTLEALRLNATAELNRKDDNSRGLWIMTGVIVRAAINMGYHREPSRSSSISIVQAEYRRRVWLSVIGMDDVASYVLGFPRMLPTIDSDTMEPRNLHDWELSENTVVLPPSRPLTEPTPATYLIVKGRLFRALSRITDLNNNPSFDSYATVLDIDNCLYQAYQDMPSNMKVYCRTGNLSTFDKKSDFSNMRLESMYHHGMCTLHRKFIAKARFDSRFTLSRDRCISSALVLLDLQNILEPSWYKFSHMRKMLTLAAMLLFLELEHRRRDSSMNPSFDNDALLQALKNSCSLWENAQRFCEEAQGISQILSGMLSSFRIASGTNSNQTESQETQFAFPSLSPQHQPFNDSISLANDIFSMSNENEIDWVGFLYLLYSNSLC